MERSDPLVQALKRYVRAELDGHTFYHTAAERTSHARGKQMYTSLAADEVEHAKELVAEYEQVIKTGGWVSLPQLASFAAGLDVDQLSVFAEGQASVLPQVNANATDLDALRMAIEMEKASYETYSKSASETSDPAAREVFEHLMKEEQRHLDLVRNSYEYLSKTDSWFEEMERPIFEG